MSIGEHGSADLRWLGAFWSGFDNAAVGMALTDTDLEFVAVNEALAGLAGRSARELAGVSVTDLVAPDDKGLLAELLTSVLRAETAQVSPEVALRGPCGTRRAVVSASVVPDEDGRTVGLLLHVQDVSQRRSAEAALELSESRFRLLVENIEGHAIYMLDTDGRVATWNRSAERLKGYEEGEVLGEHFSFFAPPEEQERGVRNQLLDQARETGSARTEGWTRRKDGSRFWAEVTMTALRDGDGELQGFATLVRDATHRRRDEEDLRQARKMEALGRLAGGVAHDFNNLLAAILGYGEVLRERLVHDPESRAEVVQILNAADRARELVAQLLAFSRKQDVQREPLDLDRVLRDLEAMLARLVGDHVELSCEVADGTAAALADRGQVEQLILNLVANAQEAMPDGGRLVVRARNATEPECQAAGRHGCVALCISDTGPGMDVATQERAFDPFFTTKGVGQGSGLGLSTVYGIARQNEGHVAIDSTPGEGTTVIVLLPAADGVGVLEPPPARPVERTRVGGEGTVLLVEDEEPVRSMLELVLRQRGYGVLEAADGAAGLDLARRHSGEVDLVITDVSMPRMNGPDLVEKLRAEGVTAKVIYISGFTARALDIGPDERFLQKPFSLTELLDTAAELLGAEASGT